MSAGHTVSLEAFFAEYGEAAAGAIVERFPPRYDREAARRHAPALRRLRRRPLGAQRHAIGALADALRDSPFALLVGEMGTGKAQPLTARVLTPTGWRSMGDLAVGDPIINAQGGTSRVIGVYPQGEKEIYRVTFSDGSSTECCADHLWLTNSSLRKWCGQAGRVRSLREIALTGRLFDGAGNARHFVPLVQPVEFAAGPLPLDPYLLGLLLGDGTLSNEHAVGFSTGDAELVAAVRALLPPGCCLRGCYRDGDTPGYDYTIVGRRIDGRRHPNDALLNLRELGLMGRGARDKFIPEAYQFAPSASRLALLQGLLDTDGSTTGKPGAIEYTTISRTLAEDVRSLVQSLGGIARISTKETRYTHLGEKRQGAMAYRLYISLPNTLAPFRLGRKAARYRARTKYLPARALVRVELVGWKEARCIAVDAPDWLYITDDFIVTHNTMISAAAAWAAGHRRSLVLCPTHLVQKWQREVEATVPGARAVILRDAAAVASFGRVCRTAPAGTPLYGIISKETAKLGAPWRPACREKEVAYRDGERGLTLRVRAATCPDCGATAVDKEGVPLPADRLAAKRHSCRACGGALWSYGDPERARGFGAAVAPRDRFAHWSERVAAVALARGWAGAAAGPRRWRWHQPGLPCALPPATRQGGHRWPLAATIERELRGLVDVFIADEVHQLKAKGSAQGQAYAALARTARHTLAATGTLLGGYSSTIFYVLQRADPAMRAEFGFHEEERWISRYGIWEEVRKKARRDVEVLADGAQSDRKEYTSVTVRERPGIHPALLLRLLPRAVFVRLADVAPDLPPYREYPVLVDMAPEQRAMYLSLERQLREALMAALQAGSKRLLGAYLQTLLSWPDNPRPEAVADGEAGAIAASVDGLPTDWLYPKEAYLLELADDARRRGRRLLVYCTHTGSRDLTTRLARLLTEHGHRVATLRAESVPAERREAWVEARVAEGIGVLLANPRCVETGLDLLAFESLVWMELDYSSYVLRQASRRSWRIGQASQVEVHYFCYAETLQAAALALMQAKIRASLLLEGELPEGGFTGEVDDDLFAQLARQLSAGASGGLGGLFTDTHEAELQADAFLEAAFLGEEEPDMGSHALVPGDAADSSIPWAGDAIDIDWSRGEATGWPPAAAIAPPQATGYPEMATEPTRPGQLSLFAAPAISAAGDRGAAAASTTFWTEAGAGDEAARPPAGPDSGRRVVSWEELAALALAERGRRRARSRPASPSPRATRLPLA